MNTTTHAGIGAITVVTAAIGGVVLLGTAASAAVTGSAQLSRSDETRTSDVRGVRTIDVDVDGADLTVRFDGSDEARLDVSGVDARGWSLERDGDRLVVRGPDHRWDWFGPDWLRAGTTATLLLPDELEGADADLSLQAGALDVDGEFGAIGVDVGAGSLTLDGAATSLDARVSAGRADITLDGVEQAEYRVSAGRLVSELTTVPDAVDLTVEAGSLVLTIPDAEYDVRANREAGSFRSDLTEADDAASTITATVSAGSIELHPAR
ncbi:hypothetical protein [Microbacterium sp.]|uniref:hypothetical protein n=1 Tax=Microbacterium sp. TaxID=51671 RepID=UPI002811513A|nr:hypothetical protein [Microbacterium sp.]